VQLGAIVGGLLGAMAGKAIEENATTDTGFEFLVKLSSGALNTVNTSQIPLNQQLHIPEIPKFFPQLLLKIHFKTFTKIHHSQWFIDIGYELNGNTDI
jgi:hypothetical protein